MAWTSVEKRAFVVTSKLLVTSYMKRDRIRPAAAVGEMFSLKPTSMSPEKATMSEVLIIKRITRMTTVAITRMTAVFMLLAITGIYDYY